jgi:type VI secretion system protein ImpA
MDPLILATPMAGADPSGPNLEYDPDFLALERAQQGRAEQVIGDAVNPGEEPNWPDVRDRAAALFVRTRDLRVAMSMTRALLQTDGFTGLATGLGIIRTLLADQWGTVHPQLDAEDHDDPTSRINSLMGLTATDGLLKTLRESPVVSSATLGRFSLRDIRIAHGKQPVPAGVTAPPLLQINAAFRDAALPSLESTTAAVSSALGAGLAINDLLTDKVGAQAPELKPLLDDLTELNGLLAEQLRNRGILGTQAVAETTAPVVAAPSLAMNGEIATRADVVRQLERICEYYQRHEPSSPIPLLLQRARRLVSKDFMTIIRDLAPSGLAEAESIGGIERSNE